MVEPRTAFCASESNQRGDRLPAPADQLRPGGVERKGAKGSQRPQGTWEGRISDPRQPCMAWRPALGRPLLGPNLSQGLEPSA